MMETPLKLVVLGLALFCVCICAQKNYIANAQVPDGFQAWKWASDLHKPRQLIRLSNEDILVVEASSSRISVLWDANNDGVSSANERVVLAEANGINHALIYNNGYLYASSATTVFRWEYTVGSHSPLGVPETVIHSMPSGGHSTRALEIDTANRLYVQLGSGSNVDKNSLRSRILRFPPQVIATPLPDAGGTNYSTGEVFADGLRNEAGIRFDSYYNLWGVENGCDNLHREDLGGDIHINNPSEKFNKFPAINSNKTGQFYGYPYCWSEYNLPVEYAKGKGTPWAHPDFINDGLHTDNWCLQNVIRPSYNLPAHTAPLDLVFYEKSDSRIKKSFPTSYLGNAFVALHGSWNREPPSGYRVVQVIFDNAQNPYDSLPFFAYVGPGETSALWPYRPAGVSFGKCGTVGDCLLISSDSSGDIVAVGYTNNTTPTNSETENDERISDLEDQVKWVTGLVVLVTILTCVLICVLIGVVVYGQIRLRRYVTL